MARDFWDQYKHPEWQKKRLEKLEDADWHCEWCYDGEATLHVHHKRYVKGRKVWEYEMHELECLCDSCHEEVHSTPDVVKEICMRLPRDFYKHVADLIVGWTPVLNEDNANQFFDEKSEAYGVGRVAGCLFFTNRQVIAEFWTAANEAMRLKGDRKLDGKRLVLKIELEDVE